MKGKLQGIFYQILPHERKIGKIAGKGETISNIDVFQLRVFESAKSK